VKAILARRYGSPEVLELVDVPIPQPAADQVVVRVRGSSVNPVDWHRLRGTPFLVRLSEGVRAPKFQGLGADVAGVVESVGTGVSTVRAGDEVFGFGRGAFAQLMAIKAEGVVAKPAAVSFEDAGAVGVAALTALQGLRLGGIAAGMRVLVAGAGGGVGSFATQIAKAFGAQVTATTSTGNLDLVRSLGAEEALDYAVTDATRDRGRYDLIFDAGGFLSLASERRALKPSGAAVLAGAGRSVTVPAIAGRMLGSVLLTKLGSRRFISYISNRTTADLETLGAMLADGRIRAVIDRRYPLDQVADAIRYQETGHARGKVAVTVAEA
jgi:NADPH:quinone reductase-like Zn-dependent oxidoreductase